jgi:NADH:ubiquinone oxidoreductase subunit 6 (subunit J)
MANLALIITALLCAIQSIRSKRLILSAIWLAGVSALLAIFFFQMGAHQVAVIELSVGAGLVTVLLIFAIGVAGEEAITAPPILPRVLTFGLVIAFVFLMVWFSFPQSSTTSLPPDTSFSTVLWEKRGLDVLTQIVLIFAGVLGLLGLLAEVKPPLEQPMADEFIARREKDLAEIERESADSAHGSLLPRVGDDLPEHDTYVEVS